jgi:hypothetical protein
MVYDIHGAVREMLTDDGTFRFSMRITLQSEAERSRTSLNLTSGIRTQAERNRRGGSGGRRGNRR